MESRHKLCLEKTAMNWSIALHSPPPTPPTRSPAASFFTASSWLPGALHPTAVLLGPCFTDLGLPSLSPALHLALPARLLLPPGQVLSADGTALVQLVTTAAARTC